MTYKANVKRCGVTLVEILIATGVFSLFMISIFGVFEYSRSGFESGSWRIQKQKQAQTFLLRLKEALERSNHAYQASPNGATERVATMPVALNQAWRGGCATATNNGIMYFSITTPYVPAQPDLGQLERTGIWKGVGLDCKDKTLKLYMTGVWGQMPPHTPADIGSPDLIRFVFGDTQGDFITSLSDVDQIGVSVSQATQTAEINRSVVFLTVELHFEKQRSRQKVQLIERMTASLVDRTLAEVVSYPAGSFPTP